MEIGQLHEQLAKLFQGGASGQQVKDFTAQLDAKELELGRISRDYAPYLQVKNASLQNLRASLPLHSALFELRAYRPARFKSEPYDRWAGVLKSRRRVTLRCAIGASATQRRRCK